MEIILLLKGSLCARSLRNPDQGCFFFYDEDTGPHLSSCIQTDLFLNRPYKHLHKKIGIQENPINLKHPTWAPVCKLTYKVTT